LFPRRSGLENGSALISYRTRPIAAPVDDTEESERSASVGVQLMRLIRRDVNRVKGCDPMLIRADAYPATPAHPDYDMAMPMALEAREAAGREFEIAQLESDRLAVLSNDHLARGAGEITAAMSA
jgi:hypothetical protein